MNAAIETAHDDAHSAVTRRRRRDDTLTRGERITRIALHGLTALVLLFLVAPILTIVPLSFSSGAFFFYPLPGLSLRWYEDFFTSTFWLPALRNSLIVGVSATVLATALGTLAALGLWRARFPAQALVLAILISPMVVPVVIVAVGVYFAFAPLGLTDGYLGLVLAHATLGVPFVVITVLATLSGFDRTLLRAAASLGAAPLAAFRRVMLPLILPGVASGAVFAFAASFDEVVVALLISGPGQRTLPRQMFAGINDNISLTIAAAATMLIGISIVLMVAVAMLQRRSARMRQGA
jgi:putative spermidine/putrescine transport system permease protein